MSFGKPGYNPELVRTPVMTARLRGKMDYLEGKDESSWRHGYRPGSTEEHHYFNGYDREFRDCVSAVMALNGNNKGVF